MIRKIAFYSISALLLFLVATFGIVQLPSCKHHLISILSQHIKNESGWSVDINTVSGIFPLYVVAEKIKFIDPKSEHTISIDQISASLSILRLLTGDLCYRIAIDDRENETKTVMDVGTSLWKIGEDLVITIEENESGIIKRLCHLPDQWKLRIETVLHHDALDEALFTLQALQPTTGDTVSIEGKCLYKDGVISGENLNCHLYLPSQSLIDPIDVQSALRIENHLLHMQIAGPPISIGSHMIENCVGLLSFDLQQLQGFFSAICTFDYIPLNLDLAINLALDPKTSAWQAECSTEGEITSLLKLLINNDTNAISGYAKLSLNAFKIEDNLEISGKIDITDTSYELLNTGAVFKNIQATFIGNHKKLMLTQLDGIDGKGGTVTATGSIEFDVRNQFPFFFNIDVKKTTVMHLDYAHGKGTGSLELQGNFAQASLSGALVVDEAVITLPEQPPPSLKMMDVTYINQPDNEALPKHFSTKTDDWPFYIDLQINIPRDLHIKSRELSSEWRGDIHLSGRTTDLTLHGGIHVINGEYSFNGKSFLSKLGMITFSGDPVHKTAIYLVAAHDIDDIHIEAVFKGPISDPKLTFHSNPPLSQKEILSWILFNKGLREITPFEGTALSQSIVTLSGGNNGQDFLSRLRRSVGIDRLDIKSSNTGETNAVSVQLGKYLTKGIFVSLNKGINSEANQVAVEAHLSKRLKIQAEIGDDAEGKLHLKWKRDY